MSSFAQRLTVLRESKDMKKKELAQILNVSPACISQYENGISMPGHDVLAHMAQFFEVSIDFLLGNEEPYFDLGRTFCNSTTYLDLLHSCAQIPAKNRAALLAIINALVNTER